MAMKWCGYHIVSTSAFLTLALLSCLFASLSYDLKASTLRVTSQSELRTEHGTNLRGHFQYKTGNLSNDVQSDQLPPTKDCSIAVERRFDCGRDRALTQDECEERGCCYVPFPNSAYGGPPWCFYPVSYPGYRMGELIPTPRGQEATLTRCTPSYLRRDVPTLKLEVMAEEAGLHLTVSNTLLYMPVSSQIKGIYIACIPEPPALHPLATG